MEKNYEKPEQSTPQVVGEIKPFFKTLAGVVIIVLVVITLITLAFIVLQKDKIDTQTTKITETNTDEKLKILEQLSKENTVDTTQSEKLNILKELSKQQENKTTTENKLELLKIMSN